MHRLARAFIAPREKRTNFLARSVNALVKKITFFLYGWESRDESIQVNLSKLKIPASVEHRCSTYSRVILCFFPELNECLERLMKGETRLFYPPCIIHAYRLEKRAKIFVGLCSLPTECSCVPLISRQTGSLCFNARGRGAPFPLIIPNSIKAPPILPKKRINIDDKVRKICLGLRNSCLRGGRARRKKTSQLLFTTRRPYM